MKNKKYQLKTFFSASTTLENSQKIPLRKSASLATLLGENQGEKWAAGGGFCIYSSLLCCRLPGIVCKLQLFQKFPSLPREKPESPSGGSRKMGENEENGRKWRGKGET